jgi:hypothetical protein
VDTHPSQVGTAVFCFVIAVHTFSLLFLRRQWSNRTCYIVLVVSWALVSFEVCIEAFAIAKPKIIGPYFGIAGLWCWITPAYPIPRYATSYLLMLISGGISLILYLLVFFRLRGNITVSVGHKIYFHQRPKVRVGRTSNGTYIVTDDKRVECHLTTVAMHMLWYPIIFLVVTLPVASARFTTFNGGSVPFSVTICTVAVFMLHGFINVVLFCTTRNILPDSWRQRLGLGSALDSRRSDSRTTATWRSSGLDARVRTIGTGTAPVVLNVGVEKDVDIMYDDAQPGARSIKLGTSLHHSHNQWADSNEHHIQQPSLPPPQDAKTSIHIEMGRVETTTSSQY